MDLNNENLMEIIVEKVIGIENNLIGLINELIEYENQLKQCFYKKILFSESFVESMDKLLIQISRNSGQVKHLMDTNESQLNDMKMDFEKSLRRESTANKQLIFVRKLYNELKDEYDWDQECRQLSDESIATNVNRLDDRHVMALVSLNHCVCDFFWKITKDESVVQQLIHQNLNFDLFMSSVVEFFKQFADCMASNKGNSDEDPTVLITISGFMVNLCGSTSINELIVNRKEINQLIHLLFIIIKDMKTCAQIKINSMMILFNISLNPTGLNILSAMNGLVKQLSQHLIDSNLKSNVEIRSLSMRMILNLINNAKDDNLYKEMVSVFPITHLQKLIRDPNFCIREECAKLMASVSHFMPEL